MSVCPHCGADIADDDKVCWDCGGDVITGGADDQTAGAPQWHQPSGQRSGTDGPAPRDQTIPAHKQVKRRQRQTTGQNSGSGQTQDRDGQQTAPEAGPDPLTDLPTEGPAEPTRQTARRAGLSRRQLLAGGGVLAVAAAGGLFALSQTGGTSPGDAFESAPLVRAGQYGPYEVTDGERHFFGVELRDGEQLTAELSFTHGEGDLDLAAHGPDAPERGDDAQLNKATSTTDDEQLRLAAQETGTYYLVAYGYDGASNEYELTIEIDDPGAQNSPGSPGSSIGDAPLTPAGRHGPYRISGEQEQYFGVSLEEGDRLTSIVSFEHAQADLDMTIRDPDGSEMLSATSTTDDEEGTVEAETSGTHFIQVYSYTDETTSYDLEIRIQ